MAMNALVLFSKLVASDEKLSFSKDLNSGSFMAKFDYSL